MLVIPVLDLKSGSVVRGVAGNRAEYRPVESRIAGGSSPCEVAQAFVDGFGFSVAYVADLDAIESGRFDVDAYRAIGDAGLSIWLDAGIASVDAARRLNESGATIDRVVVGLESLRELDHLAELGEALGGRAIFSLDLRDGRPITTIAGLREATPLEIARTVADAGFGSLIVLDLTRVGVDNGPSVQALCAEIRGQHPRLELIAGGGVRDRGDLDLLQRSGCDGALVASSLHNGAIRRADLESLA